MIIYRDNIEGITANQLKGFFVGWSDHPSSETHLKILQNSTYIVLAIDDKTNNVIGFINAISDKILSAYIPLLEVIPEYQKNGIGRKLVKVMFDKLSKLYMIDLCCDEDLKSFYQKQALVPMLAMGKRNYENQKGSF